MTMTKLPLVCLALCALLAACPTPGPSPMPPDASDSAAPDVPDDASSPVAFDASPPSPPVVDASDPVVAACAHLAVLKCAEGASSTCVSTLAKAQADKLVALALPCVTAAKDGPAVRACAPTWRNACR